MSIKNHPNHAKKNIQRYLADGLLKKNRTINPKIISRYRSNAIESLAVAKMCFEGKRSALGTISCSYYAMFYVANAYLTSIGYNTANKIAHKVTSDALCFFAVDKIQASLLESFDQAQQEAMGLVLIQAEEIVVSFEHERRKRGVFQYDMSIEVQWSKANTSLERAERFIFEIDKLVIT